MRGERVRDTARFSKIKGRGQNKMEISQIFEQMTAREGLRKTNDPKLWHTNRTLHLNSRN